MLIKLSSKQIGLCDLCHDKPATFVVERKEWFLFHEKTLSGCVCRDCLKKIEHNKIMAVLRPQPKSKWNAEMCGFKARLGA
jgi:hypothetical protein